MWKTWFPRSWNVLKEWGKLNALFISKIFCKYKEMPIKMPLPSERALCVTYSCHRYWRIDTGWRGLGKEELIIDMIKTHKLVSILEDADFLLWFAGTLDGILLNSSPELLLMFVFTFSIIRYSDTDCVHDQYLNKEINLYQPSMFLFLLCTVKRLSLVHQCP